MNLPAILRRVSPIAMGLIPEGFFAIRTSFVDLIALAFIPSESNCSVAILYITRTSP